MTGPELIISFISRRLIRTGLVSRTKVATVDDFDKAFEADIEMIVVRTLKERGLV
jgi:hypothetical protein